MNARPRVKRPASPRASQVHIVGVGASAGGLDAFRRFLKAMPADSGAAFILIQHLDPTHESHLAQLLSKVTPMKVREAVDRSPIEPNGVYVIPPNRSLAIRGNRFHLSAPDRRRGSRTPIDHFLLSLAEERGEKSICLLLSSAGTDGILGLRALKAAGGMCLVQDPATAQFAELPRAAIATGLVDAILPVEKMPKALQRYLDHPYINGSAAAHRGNGARESLDRILALVRSRTSNDFQQYKRGTLVRRIERRMGLHRIHTMPQYLKYMEKKPAEALQLSKDLMIGVTSFFRDPGAFEELRKRAIPSLVRNRGAGDAIRIWTPGCTTGEEAYSIAILVLEELAAARRSAKVQVFATDIDEDALGFARIGHFPKSIAADVSPRRLKRFFRPTAHGYSVSKELRSCVVFATQNLISSSPFSKLDLVSCRNVAIYLEPEIQKKIIEIFHFALNPGGWLFLGSSEGLAHRDELFKTVSKKWRIYRRLAAGKREPIGIPKLAAEVVAAPRGKGPAAPDLGQLSDRLLREHASYAGVLTDAKGRILHLAGPTGKYLELPPGAATLDLPSVVREGLRPRIRSALQTARREERRVVLDLEERRKGEAGDSVRITIHPVKSPPEVDGLLHVVFERLPGSPAGAERKAPPGAARDREVDRLENELKSTRDDLQNSMEEAETSSEKLTVANEEVMSANEELQSANEELETSKEELQSLNEELTTLNGQLQDKVEELTASTNDLANLLSSADIATVFLDTKLRVKRFTPSVVKLLNLIPGDVGRPLRHMAPNLVGARLLEDAQTVLRKLVPIERQIQDKSGAWYAMRVLPYRTTENVIEGVVLTFTDVSELAARESRLLAGVGRQAVIADLGRKALARMPVSRLADLAARAVRESLRADLADVLLKDETGKGLTLAAGAGWKRAVVGKARISAEGGTAAALALRREEPVIMDPIRAKPTRLQRAERVSSGVYVALATPSGSLGLLGAHSRRRRVFTSEDGRFLQDLADVLAGAIARDRVESKLKDVGRYMEERARERSVWLETAQEISRAANRSESLGDMVHRSLVALCSGGGWSFGHVFMVPADFPGRLIYYGGWYPRESRKFLAFERLTRRVDRLPLPVSVLRRGRPVWITTSGIRLEEKIKGDGPDRASTTWEFAAFNQRMKPPRAGLARRLGILSAATVPLKAGQNAFGVIEVFSDRPNPPSRPLLDMMEQAAAEIGRSADRLQIQERFANALWQEQRAIAQELHDNVGQELTGLGAMGESLLGMLHRKGRIDERRLKRLTKGLQVTLEKVRHVTRGLLPIEVDPNGLTAALGRLARQTGLRFGVECTLRSGPNVPVAGADTATHLYRIAQEAVTNAVRHSQARRIRISLERAARCVMLTVRDDGRGLPPGGAMPDGVGLRIMRHRATAIGGRLAVRSGRRGTAVICTLPRPD